MAKVPFIVSARAGKLLGRENFSNPEGAIIELVKNSYDADAKNCVVIFDVPFKLKKDSKGTEIKELITGKSQIFIIDNGEGMTDSIIKDQWMKIGTGNKETQYLSNEKRVKTGAKGIGRFALDRLGYTSEMWTLPKNNKNQKGFNWKMDWTQFDDSDKSITEITAELRPCQVNFEKIVGENIGVLGSIKKIFAESNFKNGTILKISNLKDLWFDNELADVFKSLEALIPPRELNIPFQVLFHHVQNKKDFGIVDTAFFNDFDYKLTAKYDAETLNVDFEITRNELDIDLIKKKFPDLYKSSKWPYDLSTLQEKTFKYSKGIDKLLKWDLDEANTKLLREVGSFNLTFYYLKFTVSRKEDYPYKALNTKERKNVLDKFGGVKIYRDSFRVRPYGDPDNDWLKLGARVAQSPAGAGQRIGDWRVRPEQTAGIITISRNANPQLLDKSDRGSLQENDSYEVFRSIIIKVIHEFELDRSRILNIFYKHFESIKKVEREAEIERRASVLADEMILQRKNTEEKVMGSSKSKPNLFQSEIERREKEAYHDAIKDTFKSIEENAKELFNEELVQVRGLASLGLIMSSLAHELKEVRNNSGEIIHLEKIYKKLIPRRDSDQQEYIDGWDIVELLKDDLERVKHWIDYSLTAIKKDKRKRGKLVFSEYMESLAKVWSKLLRQRDITLQINDNIKLLEYSFRAFEMDFDTIFTNLINNSIDSFNSLSHVQDRVIAITLNMLEDDIQINYQDNGIGLSDIFENKEDIFLPFTTSKRDRKGNEIGTGLGMYLVKNVIDDNNGSIEISNPSAGFEVVITFPVKNN